jgi:serine/threonine protein kinase/Tol biopolymer transport system component
MSKLSPEQWQALSPYLDRALELADDERSAWLAALRSEHPAVASQLEMLLGELRALHEEGFLEEKTPHLPRGQGLAGQELGVYTLISQIGHGGMGTVWLAERNDGRFERRVAIKMLNIALMGKGGEERFKREGRILGRLTHPHIAELIDAGVSSTGEPFLVLDYVDGEPIDRYCDQNGLDIPARIRLFLDALEGVAHAHAHHIVHRDLKPSNILVRTDGEAKLLDFGIAKLLECDGKNAEAPLTVEGGGAMTPEYAAPEQLKGEAVTAATDVYAAGVLLYVLLTGQHPAGAVPHTPARLIEAILDTEPPRPSDIVARTRPNQETAVANAGKRATTPDKLAKLLRGDLDTMIGKALKKNPQERYSSIEALAADLQRYLRYEPISARPDAIAYRAGKFVRRHWSSMTAVLLVAAALVGTAIVTWLYPRRLVPLPQFNQRKLTANAQDSPVLDAAISPDGKYLGYADQQGIHLQLVATRVAQSVALPPSVQPDTASWAFGSWFPDSVRFIASVSAPGSPSTVWSIPAAGGEAQKIAEVEDMLGGGSVSPDGSNIAYQRLRSIGGAREIWLMDSHGESAHKILTAESQATITGVVWSPAGNRLAYRYRRHKADRIEIMVQSCDLGGSAITTILLDNHLMDNHLGAFIWTPSGRFIYSRNTELGSAESDNLWELKVDAKNGTPQSEARQLTDWSGFSVYSFSITEDGKQLAFLRGNDHSSVFVGDLGGNDRPLVNTRRLTLDDNYNIPSAWMPNSREVIFSSQRATYRLIYRQSLDPGSSAELITSGGNANFYLARLSPDGASILLEGAAVGVRLGLYRVELAGGVPQRLFDTGGFVLFSCSNKAANLCVFGKPSASKDELVVFRFDPVGGPGAELARIPLEAGTSADIGFDYAWQLSPDGSRIGIVKRHGNQIRLVPLRGGEATTITVKGFPDLLDMNWAVDSKSMFVSTVQAGGSMLLRVAPNGDAQPIWEQQQSALTWGIPSPDGRHLAIIGASSEANVWMIGNF